MTSQQRRLALLTSALLVAAPALPALALEDGPTLDATLGLQLQPGPGMVGTVDFSAALLPSVVMNAGLMMAPDITSFFAGDMAVRFVGDTGAFMPLSLQTTLGFGLGTFIRTVPPAVHRSESDFGAYMFMPIGLGYTLPFLGVKAEALYEVPAVYFFKTVGSPAHWNFSLSGGLAALRWKVHYETGEVFNGPGASVGMRF